MNDVFNLAFAADFVGRQLVAHLSVSWTARRRNLDSIVQEGVRSAAFDGLLNLIDGSAIQIRHLTASPQAIPALVSGILDVCVVDEHEDGQENLEDNHGKKAEGVEVQEAFCKCKSGGNGVVKSRD